MFKFNKSKSSEPDDAGDRKKRSAFESLLESMKEEKATIPSPKTVDLRNTENRPAFYDSLSKEALAKYTKEADDIIDLFVGGMSILVEKNSTTTLRSVAKMLVAQASDRLKRLRGTSS